MRKIILMIMLFILCNPAKAQNAELNKLADIVLSLRSGGEKAYKSAITKLAADKSWTQMDELRINRDAECKASERPAGFKLNAILNNAENSQRGQTVTGNHLNGADSRYSYSLFEKTLKAGKSADYTLSGRWGEQVFLIIPYSGKLSASISCGGKKFAASPLGNGGIRLTGNAIKGEALTVTVKNDGKANISYVIINYNSRR